MSLYHVKIAKNKFWLSLQCQWYNSAFVGVYPEAKSSPLEFIWRQKVWRQPKTTQTTLQHIHTQHRLDFDTARLNPLCTVCHTSRSSFILYTTDSTGLYSLLSLSPEGCWNSKNTEALLCHTILHSGYNSELDWLKTGKAKLLYVFSVS